MPKNIVCLIEPFEAESPAGPERICTGTPLVHCGVAPRSVDEMSMANVKRLSDGKQFAVPNRLIASYPRLVSLTKAHGHYQVHHPFFTVFDGAPPSLGHVRVSESGDLKRVVEVPDSIVEAISRHPLEQQVAV